MEIKRKTNRIYKKIVPIDRLLSKIKKEENGCWIWLAGKDKDGYGLIDIDGDSVRSHRYSYCYYNNIDYKTLIKNDFILHKCDIPSCVNPDHLFKGTHKENMNDKVIKNRQIKGEGVNTSKLTYDDVKLIREELKVDTSLGRYKRIGDKYNISYYAISKIDRGITWKD